MVLADAMVVACGELAASQKVEKRVCLSFLACKAKPLWTFFKNSKSRISVVAELLKALMR